MVPSRLCIFAASIAAATACALQVPAAPSLADSAPQVCGPSLIQNGSFEHGIAPGEWTTLKAGSPGIDGWTITTGTVDIVGSLWPASDGSRSVDLDGVSFGGISQAFKTEKDKAYVVTFDFAGNPHGPPQVKHMKVSAAGQSADFSYDILNKPQTNRGWATHSFRFTANDTETTLKFDSLDTVNGYFGPVIDNVIVQATCT